MKKYSIVSIVVVIIAVFALLWIRNVKGTSYYYSQQPVAVLSPKEYAQLRTGDVIMRHGFGLISNAIVKYAHDSVPVSHCGIVVQHADSTWWVIHTVSNSLAHIDGMQQDALPKFLAESHKNSIVVQRYISCDTMAGKRIAEAAGYYLQQKVPFDDSFDTQDSSEFFCTEMLCYVFKHACNDNILQLKGHTVYNMMQFAMLMDTTRFTTIINQTINTSE